MRKQELARELARKTGVSRAEAADQVSRIVNGILQKLKSGQSANWPGIGEFNLNPEGIIEFHGERKVEKS